MLREDMCYKFGWVRDVVINNAQALTTGPNLTKQFRKSTVRIIITRLSTNLES